MLLITSKNTNSIETFSMIPINKECPYIEAIYDIDNKLLIIFSKDKKENLRVIANDKLKLNFNSNIIPINGKLEETIIIEEYYTYYIEKKEEIITFINSFSINSEEFDLKKYLDIN